MVIDSLASKMYKECKVELKDLSGLNEVTLLGVQGYRNIEGVLNHVWAVLKI